MGSELLSSISEEQIIKMISAVKGNDSAKIGTLLTLPNKPEYVAAALKDPTIVKKFIDDPTGLQIIAGHSKVFFDTVKKSELYRDNLKLQQPVDQMEVNFRSPGHCHHR